jgi:hypothetical protein
MIWSYRPLCNAVPGFVAYVFKVPALLSMLSLLLLSSRSKALALLPRGPPSRLRVLRVLTGCRRNRPHADRTTVAVKVLPRGCYAVVVIVFIHAEFVSSSLPRDVVLVIEGCSTSPFAFQLKIS